MKIFYYVLIIFVFSACSISSEEDETNYGTSDGTASAPVELTVGTAKSGSVGRSGYSYYKFTTTSGAGSYKLNIASLAISDSWNSSASVYTHIFSNSGYTSSSRFDSESCLTDCILYFDYDSLDNNTPYYLQTYGYGAVTYSLTVSKGGSEGSKDDPVGLTVSTAHSGTIDNLNYYGDSYYKFTTSDAGSYILTMTNSDDLGCWLYSNSSFTTAVDYCTDNSNISENFSGLSANTNYYLNIDGKSSTVKTTTYDITVAPD